MCTSKILLLSLATAITTVVAWPSQSFKSVPFAPPVFNITKSGAHLAPGLLLITTTDPPFPASYIVTDDGDLVWSSKTGDYANLNVQTLGSQPVLTFWNGTGSADVHVSGHGYGSVQILDSTYTELFNLCLNLGLVTPGDIVIECQADLHELYVTNHGSVLVTAYNITQADLTSLNGPDDGWVYDSLVFEIDIKTREILFSWSALKGGVSISDSKQPLGSSGTFSDPFDFFHINSIQPVGDRYLLNSRHMWTSYMIDSNGDIEWQFEGSTGGDFKLPSDIHFAWQHHARALDVTATSLTLHMFDNANSEPPFSGVNQSLGLMFSLDLPSMTSTLLKDLYDPNEALYADSQGALDLLPNGNILMGYGQIPVIREYGPAGDVRMTITFGELDDGTQQSYRAYRLDWEGVPAEAPVVVVENAWAYMSWNGATCVDSWYIYEGTNADTLKCTMRVRNSGFETRVSISNSTAFVKVAAVTTNFSKRYSSVVAVPQEGKRALEE